MSDQNLPLQRGSLRRSGRNLLKLLGGKAINVPLGLIQISLTTKLLGVEGYGFLILLTTFIGIIGDIAEFQSWQTVIHYGFKPYEDKNIPLLQRVLKFSFLLDICSCIFALIVSVLCAIFFNNLLGWPSQWHYLGVIYSFCVIFTTSATANGILRLLNRYDLIAIQGVVLTFTRFIGIIYLTIIGGGIQGAVIIWMLSSAISFSTLLIMALYQLKKQGLLTGFINRINDGITKDLPGIWKFSWNTNLNMTFSLAFGQITTQVVGSMLGTSAAGHFDIANKISEALAKPIVLLQATLYPEMVRSWQSNKPSHLYKMAFKITLITGITASVALLILPYAAPYLFTWLLHKVPTIDTLTLLYWLAAAKLVLIWGVSLEPILITTDNTNGAIYARGANIIIFIPLLLLFIDWWAIDGVGPSSFISACVLIVVQFLFIMKNIKNKDYDKQLHQQE